MSKQLSEDGRKQVAFALLLLKDFKCEGRFDVDVIMSTLSLADGLGVRAEYDQLITQVPKMQIRPSP